MPDKFEANSSFTERQTLADERRSFHRFSRPIHDRIARIVRMKMTIDEAKLISFIVIALLAGSLAKSYRAAHPRPKMSTPPPKTATGRFIFRTTPITTPRNSNERATGDEDEHSRDLR